MNEIFVCVKRIEKSYAILNSFGQGQALQTTPKEFAMTLYQSKIFKTSK